MDIYYQKYIKYKTKYLNLKKQIGGNCNEYDDPANINSVIHSGAIEYLNMRYYVIYHAYKHMDSLGLPCNYDGMTNTNNLIHGTINNNFHKNTLEQIYTRNTEGKLIQQLPNGLYMYMMVSFDRISNQFRVFQIFRCDQFGNPLDTQTYAQKAQEALRARAMGVLGK